MKLDTERRLLVFGVDGLDVVLTILIALDVASYDDELRVCRQNILQRREIIRLLLDQRVVRLDELLVEVEYFVELCVGLITLNNLHDMDLYVGQHPLLTLIKRVRFQIEHTHILLLLLQRQIPNPLVAKP